MRPRLLAKSICGRLTEVVHSGMEFCQQATPYYCVVACICSILNRTTKAEQKALVERFPEVFHLNDGEEGKVCSYFDLSDVIQALGLADRVAVIKLEDSPAQLPAFLVLNRDLDARFLLTTTKPEEHAFLVTGIHVEGIEVMDPAYGGPASVGWRQLLPRRANVVALVSGTNMPQIPQTVRLEGV